MRRALLCLWILSGCDAAVAPTDTGTEPDAPDAPSVPEDAGCARVVATIGASGGTIVHCDGARLELPAGALSADTELFVERVASPPSITAPYVLAGPAFTFGPSGVVLAAPANVVLPTDGGDRMELAVLVDGAWQVVEACASDATTISQAFGGLGTFVATRDPNTYPPGPSGIGEGSIDFVLGGAAGGPEQTGTLDIEYAIDEAVGSGETLTLVFRRSDAAGLVQFDLRFGTTDTGMLEAVQLAYADTSVGEIWDVISFLHPGDLSVELTTHDARTVAGTITATLHLGDATRSLTATFTATHAEWRYPPERACGMPEG